MTCERCGQREATVHLVELVEGQKTSQWLCTTCAGRSSEEDRETPPFGFGGNADDGNGEEDTYSLASFLGQVFEPLEIDPSAEVPACSACGYSLDQFRKTNRLGCPRCYDSFRQPLLSILSHLHRHVSHLGKVPGSGGAGTSRKGALGRVRVALEKAIAAEDFEKAARLRDEILHLEASDPTKEESGS